ncbi:RnaseH [Senna tora]|uniref:RnaseH (Mitochondrion) n=1 Tax=Senna tora TaxID=362788 RepID=A0A834WAJ2_9FABA|nr:RnaseH [Senna tora]
MAKFNFVSFALVFSFLLVMASIVDASRPTPTADGILRDSHGNWVKGYLKFIGGGSSVKTEIWAMIFGLRLACDMQNVNL